MRKLCIFSLLQVAAVNSYTLYRSTGGNGSYLDFVIDVCRCLITSEDITSDDEDEVSPDELPPVVYQDRSLSANDIPNKIRHDKIIH